MGKGDTPRPLSVSAATLEDNWRKTFHANMPDRRSSGTSPASPAEAGTTPGSMTTDTPTASDAVTTPKATVIEQMYRERLLGG